MAERLKHPVSPPESSLGHPRPPEPGARREIELRPIAEDLITALESKDREDKIKAVIGVLSRFELKKPHAEPRPAHPRPPVHDEHPEPLDLLAQDIRR